MKTGDRALIVLAVGACIIFACGLLSVVFPRETERVGAVAVRAIIASIVFVGAAIAIITAALTYSISARLINRARRIYPDRETRLFPMLPAGSKHFDPNPPETRLMAAASSGRVSAATARAIITQPPPPRPTAPVTIDSTAEIVTDWQADIDLRRRPHIGLFGETGSGKSTAIYGFATALAKADPAARFLLIEPGGATWGSQTMAYTDDAIAAALIEAEAEMDRRLAALRAANVPDAHDLHAPAPQVVDDFHFDYVE